MEDAICEVMAGSEEARHDVVEEITMAGSEKARHDVVDENTGNNNCTDNEPLDVDTEPSGCEHVVENAVLEANSSY